MSVEMESNASIDLGTSLVDLFNEDQSMHYSNEDASTCSTSANEDSNKPAYNNDDH